MSGFKTSEFWLAVLLILGFFVSKWVGKPVDINEILALAGVVGIYTGQRGWLKSKEITT